MASMWDIVVRFVKRLIAEKVSDEPNSNRPQEVIAPEPVEPAIEPPSEDTAEMAQSHADVPRSARVPSTPSRHPHIIQIGLDFGTSYCKCVCRDVNTDKAWVYVPSQRGVNDPFLLPSALQVKDGAVCLGNPDSHYHPGGLPHIKMALAAVGRGLFDDPVLKPFRAMLDSQLEDRMKAFVTVCGVYLLGGILGDIKNAIRMRSEFNDFGEHEKDSLAVNLAVPVADDQDEGVHDLYQRVIEGAFKHADKLAGHQPIPLADLAQFVPESHGHGEHASESVCFIYPEVSAGVQGFVRSRVAASGVYFFTDTGAGTVDQSVFILGRRPEGDHLTYLEARVLPLGSSHIERRAAEQNGGAHWENLDAWRKRKENGMANEELENARNSIKYKLTNESETTAFNAATKHGRGEQFRELRLMFGGGGHSEIPYASGVVDSFQSPLIVGPNTLAPNVVGMPWPRDLEPANELARWMPRLWVAYGLSFWRGNLADFTYPVKVNGAQPRPVRDIQPAEERYAL